MPNLVTIVDAKAYLRLQTDAEDVLLSGLLASAISMIESWLGRPLELEERTFVDSASDTFGTRCARALRVPVTPVAEIVSVTDDDGTEVPEADLRVDPDTGLVTRRDRGPFLAGPYTVVAEVGLEARPDYTTRVVPVINQAILDVVADLYQRRNPAASREAEGGGIAVDYNPVQRGVGADNAREDLLPERTAAILAPFRLLGV
jgi:uncharacterized phiE125 gp8 family phage protein